MSNILNTYEQFCKAKNRNVLLEEHITPDGEYIIRCRHREECENGECKCVKQISESIKISKSFQK